MNSNSIQLVREYVRTVARQIKKEQKEKLREEIKLRRHVRRLINEVEEVSPHSSTGINVLEDLLKTIIPIIEVGYKRLTSDEQQRKSYRAHSIRALQNLLSTESVYFNADKKMKGKGKSTDSTNLAPTGNAPLEEQDEDVSGDSSKKAGVEKNPAFIDIEKDKKKKDAEASQPKPEDAFQELPGEDPTGRGFALRTFNKIKNQTLDSYSLLGKEEDKEMFYDYLLTNVKLYFDKFEDELQNKLEEPTTPEYEAEKQKKQQSLGSGQTPAAATPAPVDAGTVPDSAEGGGIETSTAPEELGKEDEEEKEELEIELDEDLEEEEED